MNKGLPGTRKLLAGGYEPTGCNTCGGGGAKKSVSDGGDKQLKLPGGIEIRRTKKPPSGTSTTTESVLTPAKADFVRKAALLFQLHGSGTWDYINAFVTGAQARRSIEEAKTYLDSLIQNQRDIGDHFGSRKLGELLVEHIQGAGAVLDRVRDLIVAGITPGSQFIKDWINVGRFKGDQTNRTQAQLLQSLQGNRAQTDAVVKLRDAIEKWYKNADQIANYLASLSPQQLPTAVVGPLFYTHLRQAIIMAAHLLNQEYKKAVELRAEYLNHIVAIGEAAANALAPN